MGYVLAKSLARGGYHVFADQDYESRVRGGHNFFRVRVSNRKVAAISDAVNILVALDRESVDLHQKELVGNGAVVFDGEALTGLGGAEVPFPVPLRRLAEESARNRLMANTVALGVVTYLMDYDLGILSRVLEEHFGEGDVGRANVAAAASGYEHARASLRADFAHQLRPVGDRNRMLLTGNEAIALGAIAAGCKFMAAYPMTPATSIMEYMAGKAEDLDLVVVQPEDEISAINMIIGAAFAGARSMTATSGGGFCLMVEGLGLAGMTETPIVVIEGQRPGPAIGLPTRTEQGDLEFMIHAAHGEFPRAVLAPATIEDAFWVTVRAFNLAEKYQVPVIVLTDQHLASSYATADKLDISKVTVDRGSLLSATESDEVADYRRHRVTASGISPRALPLEGTALVVTDSDEHDEEGHMVEDAEARTRMLRKRMRKSFGLRKEIASPRVYGHKRADTTLVGWGSTFGAIREAVDILRREDLNVNAVHLTELWPFPAESVADALSGAGRCYVIENNASGQLSHLIQAETGKRVTDRILKYDGRPFVPAEIARRVRKGVCSVGNDD